MLLAHHANGRMCITNTVLFILILPASSESYVQHWIVTEPVHIEGKFFFPFLLTKRVLMGIVPKYFSRSRDRVESGQQPQILSFQFGSRVELAG